MQDMFRPEYGREWYRATLRATKLEPPRDPVATAYYENTLNDIAKAFDLTTEEIRKLTAEVNEEMAQGQTAPNCNL